MDCQAICSLRVNGNLQVTDEDYNPIPGLYAAGQDASGLYGAFYNLGIPGSIAAYELAKAGKSVLVVERGDFAGAKNMTGGRLYVHLLRKVFNDDVLATASFERRIIHERISMMGSDTDFTIDFKSGKMNDPKTESYSVLRAPLDQWLAEQAENEGAEYICCIPVDSLIKLPERIPRRVREERAHAPDGPLWRRRT